MQSKLELVGRDIERAAILACLRAQRNVLLEGPVGVGKMHLVLSVVAELGSSVIRVDGDGRYSEQKLSGWFDPPTVIKTGYGPEAFIAGPLVEAMRSGGILFINELNRLPEGVQNILLPAIDERMIIVPRLGEIRAAPGFLVVATQNPKEFVATSHLSEAILDRFELIVLDYQDEPQELQIIKHRLGAYELSEEMERLSLAAVRIVRLTRDHPRIRRGASIRAALGIAEIGHVLLDQGAELDSAFLDAVKMALPTRIEIEREAEGDQSAHQERNALLEEWVREVLAGLDQPVGAVKKKR